MKRNHGLIDSYASPCPTSLQFQSSLSLIIQELLLLYPTPLQVDTEQYDAETDGTQGRKEVERCGVVVRWRGIYDGGGDEGTNKRRGFADYVEEGEEEKFLASRCDLGDLYMSLGSQNGRKGGSLR